MPNCCVTGCHNRYYPGSTIRFYRVPSGNRQFQVQRRRLWIEAIQQANGSSEIRADARICGVHFISGEASTDPDRPNFVPTLFTCSKLRQGPTRKAKWTSSACRRSQRQKSNVETKTITTRGDDEENEDTTTVRDDEETEDTTTVRDDEETEDTTTVRDDEETEDTTNLRDDEETEDTTNLRDDEETEDTTNLRDDEETEDTTTVRDEETEDTTNLRDNEETEDTTTLTENEDITALRDDEETEKSPSQSASQCPMEHQSSALIETSDGLLPEMQTLPVSKEEEAEDEKIHDRDQEVTECEAEPETMETENKSSPSPSPQKLPGSVLKPDKMNPVVLIKPLVLPQGAYHVDLSSSTAVSSKEQHEDVSQGGLTESSANKDQPSFPCNLCDRTFTTSHYLKRHKLLHVRDVRKCLRCGALFCRRHNHVLFQTRAEPLPESEESSSSSEDEPLDAEQEKTRRVTEKADNALNVQTATPPDSPALSNSPLLKTSSLTDVSKPLLVSVKPAAVPSPPSPITRFPSNPGTVFQIKPLLSDTSPALIRPNLPQQPQLPPSLKIFSTQHLTSALLDVQRNYEYILSKPKNVVVKFKEEPEEPVQICPVQKPVKQVKLEKIAYDLEMVI